MPPGLPQGFAQGTPASKGLPLHEVSEPSEAALAAWRAFLGAHARVTRSLEAELQSEQQLSLAEYDVLVQLAEAPGQSLRMAELADSVLLSRSGVTRLVDRLVRGGYLSREATPDDLRGRSAVLTSAGLERLRRAAPTHLRGVRQYVTDRLSAPELEALRQLMDRLG
jgi:DNA-binding MarR family transcriptional regulator